MAQITYSESFSTRRFIKPVGIIVVSLAMVPVVFNQANASATGWLTQIYALESTVKLMTKQVDLAANKTGQYATQALQALATHKAVSKTTEATVKVVEDFAELDPAGKPLGQLSQPCYQGSITSAATKTFEGLASNKQLNALQVYATNNTDGVIYKQKFFGFAVEPSGNGVPMSDRAAGNIITHNTRYCTVSEASLGVCDLVPNGMQGADSDVTAFFDHGKTFSPSDRQAMSHFIANVAPTGLTALQNSTQCKADKIKCAQQTDQTLQTEAAMSMARASFLGLQEDLSSPDKSTAEQRP